MELKIEIGNLELEIWNWDVELEIGNGYWNHCATCITSMSKKCIAAGMHLVLVFYRICALNRRLWLIVNLVNFLCFVRPSETLFFFSPKRSYVAVKPYISLSNKKINKKKQKKQ
jgi:hypothetical protein